MAMFPNATKGLMPFVPSKSTSQNKHKRSKPHVNGGKLNNHRSENRHVGAGMTKLYQVTLKDKKGYTYKYIVKSDGTKSLPELAEQKISLMASHSMPNIEYTSPEKQRKILAEKVEALNSLNSNGENFSTSLDLRECGKKEGLFSTFLRFIKEKTGKGEKEKSTKPSSKKSHKSKSGKSKRKPRDLSQRKRQRTVSAMSNLDPIQESPNEHEYEDEDDTDSYTHDDTASSSDSDASSVASSLSCSLEVEQIAS